MQTGYEKALKCYECIKDRLQMKPKIALVLGSGLGAYTKAIRQVQTIDYSEIEGFPVSTVPGHEGRFVLGYLDDIPMVVMQGRVHYYEGYAMSDVVLPIRLMRLMGAEILFLTNAAGGVNYHFEQGDLMLIKDQISSFVPSPLIGKNEEIFGPRFADMSEIYDLSLQKIIKESAMDLKIPLKEGVYVQLSGPGYESPAEIRMVRILGADAVGMSTACEAVAANHMGMKIWGISCITNLASGMSTKPLDHKEVQETADRMADSIRRLIGESIRRMAKI